ncbi:MAG TPA: bifunctional phosphopantothenoylcysteine decarboxylase/phosphopantothenate--cysteine ligase CoaBC [Candidatus Gastranaerophilaceae bacterium]|nr:bifunctional phosphopantothenoylcysteine decarboxylase/phosphopantothenate--cysteine ligase CoaBC [Candidatus Gastranaerophilaceae bacterium]HPT41691.1 bifunctional phosphopantothenoylcysteine decarboxylase/phosphopantothenate--cysteine ligase CoaBC [Candidatus Gastranaerophilaceae bacterium]
MLKGKKVLLGITGGIAAYKMCEFIRMLQKQGAQVKVVTTPSALNFVTKLTLQALSKNKAFVDMFEDENYSPEHISLADDADIFIIAPASANTISKLAMGICDNLLTTVACAFKKPIILAPAMNCNMWENKIIQENLEKLEQSGYHIYPPEEGYLACGYEGAGRLCDLNKLLDKTVQILTAKKKLNGKKIVITAGGTREKIDAVRFISNFSSGKMGLALADQAFEQGAEVVLITTVLPRPLRERAGVRGTYQVRLVESALDMQKAVEKEFKTADCLIMAAAVADYRAKKIADKKMKKTSAEEICVDLVKNPDILKEIGLKRRKNQLIIGFCAESENVLEYAKSKIKTKGCDFLVANDISRSDIGFSSDYNEVYIVDKKLKVKKISRTKKECVAKQILEIVYEN